MSQQALGAALDRLEAQSNPESTPAERDRIELIVRRVSRFAGYLSLALAVAGIAYLVIR
ncbi:hypothetical protein [Sphingomonas mali]|uniref:hypothetical protein n=1 Tax=Sphingomonas mali TaxID=40682 RepID=UPI000A539C8D|nr:hypothetical protein [Sphingomonas mali]